MQNDPQNTQTPANTNTSLALSTQPDQSSQQKTEIIHKKESIFRKDPNYKAIFACIVVLAFGILLLILIFNPDISSKLLPSSLSNLPKILLGAITFSGFILTPFLDPGVANNEKAKGNNSNKELANKEPEKQNSQTLGLAEKSKQNEAPGAQNSQARTKTSWTQLVLSDKNQSSQFR